MSAVPPGLGLTGNSNGGFNPFSNGTQNTIGLGLSGLSLLGGLFGSNNANNAYNQAQQAGQQASTGETDIINQLLPMLNSMYSQYQGSYQPVDTQAGSSILSMLQGINPSGVSGAANQLLNPNSMVSGLGGTGGTALNFFTNEGQNGLSQASINNATQSYNQGALQTLNSARNSLGSSLANPTGALSDLAASNVQGRAQLGSNLAAQNQSVQNQGMLSAFSTATGIDQNTLAQLLGGNSIAQGTLNQGLQYGSQGQSLLNSTQGGLQGIMQAYQQAAAAAQQNAMQASQQQQQNNPFGGLVSTAASLLPLFGL